MLQKSQSQVSFFEGRVHVSPLQFAFQLLHVEISETPTIRQSPAYLPVNIRWINKTNDARDHNHRAISRPF